MLLSVTALQNEKKILLYKYTHHLRVLSEKEMNGSFTLTRYRAQQSNYSVTRLW